MAHELVTDERLRELVDEIVCNRTLSEELEERGPENFDMGYEIACDVLKELRVSCVQEVTPGRSCSFAGGLTGFKCQHPAWKGVARDLPCGEKWCPLAKGAALVRARK